MTMLIANGSAFLFKQYHYLIFERMLLFARTAPQTPLKLHLEHRMMSSDVKFIGVDVKAG